MERRCVRHPCFTLAPQVWRFVPSWFSEPPSRASSRSRVESRTRQFPTLPPGGSIPQPLPSLRAGSPRAALEPQQPCTDGAEPGRSARDPQGTEEAAGDLWGRSSLPPGRALHPSHPAGSLGSLLSRTICRERVCAASGRPARRPHVVPHQHP